MAGFYSLNLLDRLKIAIRNGLFFIGTQESQIMWIKAWHFPK